MTDVDVAVAWRVLAGRERAALLVRDARRVDAVLEGRALLARKARSFALAARFLPGTVRDDLSVVYGFCRLADDLADEASSVPEAQTSLAQLLAEVEGRAPARPIVGELREVMSRVPRGEEIVRLLLEGITGDLGDVRMRDDADLLCYSYRVASTVGLLLCGVLGVRRAEALPFAVDLGIGMQLSNIVRDVGEDARRGRVYLPASRLAAAGVPTEDLLSGRADRARLERVLSEVVSLADGYYRSAERGMVHIPWRCRLSILAASRLYGAIGRRLVRERLSPLDQRVVVPRAEKAWALACAMGTFVGGSLRASGARDGHDATRHALLPEWPGVIRAAALPH